MTLVLTPENLGEVLEAGAERVAVVRALTEAADGRATAEALRRRLEVPVGAT